MLKHILFVIHGMGQFDTDWAEAADGPITTLRDLSTQYRFFREDYPIDDLIEFVPLTYDHIFKDITQRWRHDVDALGDLEPDFHNWISEDAKSEVLNWLRDPAHDDDFWWTHSADVLMYRLIPAYRNRVRTDVLRQIGDVIEREVEAGHPLEFSVLAHSLGTAVMHDCIHLLGTQSWRDEDEPNAMKPSVWRFQRIVMVANTSRLLGQPNNEVPHSYESIVRPGDLRVGGTYCLDFVNCRHKMDPVTWPLSFQPPDTWASEARFHEVVVQHYRSLDVHGLSHYLQHPSVHIPLLKLANPLAVSDNEAATEFPDVERSPEFEAKIARFEQKVEQMGVELGDMSSDTGLISMLMGFYEIVRGES
jgi:hypothetical protein